MRIQGVLFSELDKKILIAMVRRLHTKQRRAITLQYWENMRTHEIATKMRLPWKESYKLVSEGLKELKGLCERHPCFLGKKNEM